MRTWILLFALAVAGLPTLVSAPAPFSTFEAVWHDSQRDRDVPVKIYFPAGEQRGPFPVIVFSHGLGGSREGYRYLGEDWAAHGYVSVHLQHLGSDEALLKGGRPRAILRKLRDAVMDPANAINRPLDVRFAIDRLEALAHDPKFPLHDRIDLARLGIAGHSFGAYTVLAVAGQVVGNGDGAVKSLGPDPRVKAAIAMSSQAPRRGNLATAYDPIAIPIFHMTGTLDTSPLAGRGGNDAGVGGARAADRRVAFDHTRHAPACLLTFQGGDHQVFSGQRRRGDGAHDAEFHALLLRASVAFWDAQLKGDATARHWLEDGGFAAALGSLGTFELKNQHR